MSIKIDLKGFKTLQKDSSIIYIKGTIFFDEKKIEIEEIFDILKNNNEGIFEKFSGFYSLVYLDKDKLIASVDIIRSIPLFYFLNEKGDVMKITNSIYSINSDEIKEIDKDIFKLCAYSIGDKTLLENIKQITAGNYIVIKLNDLKPKIYSYFRFYSNNISLEKFNKDLFLKKLDDMLLASFKKLKKYSNDRQLIVPLSGGYDSRLIVSFLKRLEFTNVKCFSYGVKGNEEAKYSKRIAESLGYEWIFIEYSKEKWEKNWNTCLSDKYIDFASNKSSFPHIQDWLAVKEMREMNIIDDSAIFVPGHCCVTSYITKDLIGKKINGKNFFTHLKKNHFNLTPLNKLSILKDSNILYREIDNIINKYNSQSLVSAIMQYNWEERQSKYIANSVRVYEFFNYSWWLPLWDKGFVNLFINMPDEFRINRDLYILYVNKIYMEASNSAISLNNPNSPSVFKKILRSIIESLSKDLFHLVLRKYNKKRFNNHSLAFNGLIDEVCFNKCIDEGYEIIGIYCKKFLEDMSK